MNKACVAVAGFCCKSRKIELLKRGFNDGRGAAMDEKLGSKPSLVRLPDPSFLKTRLMSGQVACLKLPICLFLQSSAELAGSAAKVLTKSMSKMCMTREA